MLTATIRVLPAEFAVKEDQPLQLEGDVLVEKATWATLAEDKELVDKDLLIEKSNDEGEVIKFEKLQLARHLRPLYIKAYIDSRAISRILIDGGTIMNVMPVEILKKLGKTQNDLKETNMKMNNFTRESTKALDFYIAEFTLGSKTSNIVFFVIDAKPRYSLLLG